MIRRYFIWLFIGIIFWGFIFGLISFYFFDVNSLDKIIPFLLDYLLITFILTLIPFASFFYAGGFPVGVPKLWFFFPLLSWIWITIEGFFLEGRFFNPFNAGNW